MNNLRPNRLYAFIDVMNPAVPMAPVGLPIVQLEQPYHDLVGVSEKTLGVRTECEPRLARLLPAGGRQRAIVCHLEARNSICTLVWLEPASILPIRCASREGQLHNLNN